jgi:hypothetical protein
MPVTATVVALSRLAADSSSPTGKATAIPFLAIIAVVALIGWGLYTMLTKR